MDLIHPPWSHKIVDALNRYQREAPMHPFTCVNRDGAGHSTHGERDIGILMATPAGWYCRDCAYTQGWAHAFMADNSWWASSPLVTAKLAHEETPNDGHTFRITVNVRGSSKVVGDEHAKDAPGYHHEPWEVEVREHSLVAALRKAARVPFSTWAESAKEEHGFWDRLGLDEGGLPAHLPMGMTKDGQGPEDDSAAHHYECWCPDVDCPLTKALRQAWSAGRRLAVTQSRQPGCLPFCNGGLHEADCPNAERP